MCSFIHYVFRFTMLTNRQTRRRTQHFLLGQPSLFPQNQLPLEYEVFNHYKFLRDKETTEKGKAPNIQDIAKKVAEDICNLWISRGNLKTIELKSVVRRVETLLKRGNDLLKIIKGKRESLLTELENNENQKIIHKKKIDTLTDLFDISPCKHEDIDLCDCPKEKKVPKDEWEFMQDQRSARNLYIGSRDMNITNRWKRIREAMDKKLIRLTKETQRVDKLREDEILKRIEFVIDSLEAIENNNIPADPEFTVIEKKEHNQNRQSLSNYSAELDRYTISDTAGAALVTAAYKDLGLITDEDKKMVTDKFKIRRERQKRRKEKKRKRKEEQKCKIKCMGTDGKRDKKTKVINEKEEDGKVVRMYEEISEEHIVYTDEPSGRYITHSVIESGRGGGLGLGRDIADTARECDSEEILEALLLDGTRVNTGCNNGAIAVAERELGRSLQWLVCQLHGNECPMRHVFEELDGGHGTSGPKSFKGPMGQNLTDGNVHKKEPVCFEPIKSPLTPLPEDVIKNLSRDQKLLYRYTLALDSGVLPSDLANQSPPGINHARWLTLCLTAQIDYTRDPHPSNEKISFVKYIQEVYVPSWFHIKSHGTLRDGAKNVFYAMELIKKQSKRVQDVAKKSFQTNAYFAHSENLLAAMLCDEDETIRQKAINAILTIRRRKKCKVKVNAAGIRVFRVPQLNWEAKNYMEIIPWEVKLFTEPPVTKQLSNDELMCGYGAPLDIPKYPAHSQSVELCVKLVSEATKAVYGHEQQHSLCISKQSAREERPAYVTK